MFANGSPQGGPAQGGGSPLGGGRRQRCARWPSAASSPWPPAAASPWSAAPSASEPRPSHLVAVRLVSPEVQRRVQQLQQWFVAQNPLYERCLVPLQRLHTALLLTSVEAGQEPAAQEACREAGRLIRDFLGGQPVELVLSGVGSFRGRVLFARVRSEPPERLEAARHLLSRAFMRHGLPVRDETGQAWLEQGQEPKTFWSHASFLKVTRALANARSDEERRELRPLHISEAQLAHCRGRFFGTQACTEFELLAMLGCSSDGYYRRLRSEPFSLPPPVRPGEAEQAVEAAWTAGAPVARNARSTDSASASGSDAGEAAASSVAAGGGAPSARGGGPAAGACGQRMSPELWQWSAASLSLRELLCFAAACRTGLEVLRGAVRAARVVLFSVGTARSNHWEGSCSDWDRRGNGEGEYPLELQNVEGFLCQQAASAVAADVGFAEDAQEQVLGRGPQRLREAVRRVLPRCLADGLQVEVEALRNVSAVPPGLLATLAAAQPRILGLECLAAAELADCGSGLRGLHRAEVFVHAWDRPAPRPAPQDAPALAEPSPSAEAFEPYFAALLGALPSAVWGLDLQNMSAPLCRFPAGQLPPSCRAFGTVVLQREVSSSSARGSMTFQDFLDHFPAFPPHVALVRASLGTDAPWRHSAQVVADGLRRTFPGLSVLQLELSLKGSVAIVDVPFIELAQILCQRGVRVEVTDLRCAGRQYEFLRAALGHAGAAVHDPDAEEDRACSAVFPFSHPRYARPHPRPAAAPEATLAEAAVAGAEAR